MQVSLKDVEDGDEHPNFSDRFELLGTLGRGAFGLVVSAIDKFDSNNLRAVKVIREVMPWREVNLCRRL